MKRIILGIIIGAILFLLFLFAGGPEYLKKFGQKTEEAGEKLGGYEKELKRSAKEAKEAIVETGEMAKEAVMETKEKAKKTMDETVEKTRELVDDVTDKAADASEKVGDAAKAVGDATGVSKDEEDGTAE